MPWLSPFTRFHCISGHRSRERLTDVALLLCVQGLTLGSVGLLGTSIILCLWYCAGPWIWGTHHLPCTLAERLR